MKRKKKMPFEDTNRTVDNRLRRYELRCPHCMPNRGENEKPKPKRGTKKPKKKDHRK